MPRDSMRCLIEREGNEWKAYCVDADVRVRGHTSDEARSNLDRALEQYCYERRDRRRERLGSATIAHRFRYVLARLFAAPDTQFYDFKAPPDIVVGLA